MSDKKILQVVCKTKDRSLWVASGPVESVNNSRILKWSRLKISNAISMGLSVLAVSACSAFMPANSYISNRHHTTLRGPMYLPSDLKNLSQINMLKDLPGDFDDVTRPLSETDRRKLTPTYSSTQCFADAYPAWSAQHPDAKLLCLIRHGESFTNVCELTQSHDAFSPLTPRGELQRDEMCEFMQSTFLDRGINFDRYVASDLERAYESIRPLAEKNGQSPEILKRFREVLISMVGGIPREEDELHFPNQWERYLQNPLCFELSGKDPDDKPAFSGEVNRWYLRHYIDKFVASDDNNAIVGTHGITILVTLMEIFNISPEKFKSMKNFLNHSGNLGITLVAFNTAEKIHELLVYADDSYLSDAVRGFTTSEETKNKYVQQLLTIADERRVEKTYADMPPKFSDYYPIDPLSVQEFGELKVRQEIFLHRRRVEKVNWLDKISEQAPHENVYIINQVLIPYIKTMLYDSEADVRLAAKKTLEVLTDRDSRPSRRPNELVEFSVIRQLIDCIFSPFKEPDVLIFFNCWLETKRITELENKDHPFLGWGCIELSVSPAIKALSNLELKVLLYGAGLEAVTDDDLKNIRKAKDSDNILHPMYLPELLSDDLAS